MAANEENWGKPIAPVDEAYRSLPPPFIPYVSPRLRAIFAIVSLAAAAIGFGGMSLGSVLDVVRLNDGQPALFDDEDMPVFTAFAVLFVAAALIIGMTASMVCVATWFYRSYKNLPLLVNGQFLTTPAWAVGAFFIPFVNLVRPYQAAREIEVYSDPGFEGGRFASAVGGSSRLKLWWGSWISGNLLANVSSRIPESGDVQSQITVHSIDALAYFLITIAALALIFVIRKITNDQDASARRLMDGNLMAADMPPHEVAQSNLLM